MSVLLPLLQKRPAPPSVQVSQYYAHLQDPFQHALWVIKNLSARIHELKDLCAETDDALLTREEQLMSCKSLPALGISREDLRRRMISSLKPIAERDEGSLGSRRLGAIQECPT